ncbi:MAG: DUF447 domain-containing protein [Gammaproteobacteria bacterium]
MIYETIITTINEDGAPHFSPMGIYEQDGMLVIAPFRPSVTLENLQRTQSAVINMTDDVTIFAGCLTGRNDWPTVPAEHIKGQRLLNALSHIEVEVDHCDEDESRPGFFCSIKHKATHTPFMGFNRAQASVIEVAILVSRLRMLSQEKIESEIGYLQIAIDKTAGEKEKQAWAWLMEYIEQHKTEHRAEERIV